MELFRFAVLVNIAVLLINFLTFCKGNHWNTCQTLLPIIVLTLSVFICITEERKYDAEAMC